MIEEYPTENNAEMILMNQLHLIYSSQEIQNFLEKQPGNLKNYVYTSENGFQYSAADLLTISNQGPGYNINPKVLLVIMELLSESVTSPQKTTTEFSNSMKIENEDYWNYLEKMPEFNFPESVKKREQQYSSKNLSAQIATVSASLDFAFDCWSEYQKGNQNLWCSNQEVVFQNGEKRKITNALNAETFALESVLASLSEDVLMWEKWISKEPGSFYQIYSDWFNTPLIEIQALEDENLQNIEIPFLKQKPYHHPENSLVNLNSFYDHEYPNYTFLDQNLLNFVDKSSSYSTVNCNYLGYNCYGGHDGTDYSTFDNPIYAPSEGRVFVIKPKDINPVVYGNVVYLKHDSNQDGIFDYITLYAHLDDEHFAEGLKVGDVVEVNQFLGISGGTGGDYPDHLHFGVRKIIYNDLGEIANETPEYHLLVDPYGWWGETKDPAAGREQVWGSYKSTVSDWLWGEGESQLEVDNTDVAFQHFVNKGIFPNALWNEIEINETDNQTALMALTSLNLNGADANFRTWDNWAFWVGNLPKANRYKVEVRIPSYQIPNQDVSSEVRYQIFHQANTETGIGQTEVIINQAEHQGEWLSLGEYDFEAGAKAAVRLVDEVQSENNIDKIIWADAVKWTPVEANGPQLFLSQDEQIFENNFNSVEVDFGFVDIGESKELEFTVKNTGNEVLDISEMIILPIEIDSPVFEITQMPKLNLEPLESSIFTIKFTPKKEGSEEFYLRIFTNIQEDYYKITLKGASGYFSDVQQNDWFRRYVKYVAEQGVVEGYGDGTFGPANPVTRAEVLKMAYEGKGVNLENLTGENVFEDINPEDWFYQYVLDAQTRGYVSGIEIDGVKSFYPNLPVTRYEAAKIVHAVFNNIDYRLESGQCRDYQEIFFDVQAEDWFCQATHWMYNSVAKWKDSFWDFILAKDRIASGYRWGSFAKEYTDEIQNINRAEMAKIIANAMNFMGDSNVLPASVSVQNIIEEDTFITLGNNYEQTIEGENNTSPASLHLPNGDIQSIFEGDSLDLNFERYDSDGDELFYFWNATGGSFEAIDTEKFAHITWTAPKLENDTTFYITVIRGDGRGLIGEGKFEIKVKAQTSLNLEPTINAKLTGGDWNKTTTWEEGRLPNSSDIVAINGIVKLSFNLQVKGMIINTGAKLTNYCNNTFTVETDFKNNGTIEQTTNMYCRYGALNLNIKGNFENNGPMLNVSNLSNGIFNLSLSGNLQNNSTMGISRITLKEAEEKLIQSINSIPGEVVFEDDIEIKNNVNFSGTLNLNSKILTVNYPYFITFGGHATGKNGIINGTGKVGLRNNIYGDLSGNISELQILGDGYKILGANLTFPKIRFLDVGARYLQTPLTINGDIEISPATVLQDTSYNSILNLNGDLINYGIFQNYDSIYQTPSSFTVNLNGQVINNGTIKNNGKGSLYLKIFQNIENNGNWIPKSTTFLNEQGVIANGKNAFNGEIVLGKNIEILNNANFSGILNLNEKNLIINSPYTVTVGGHIYNGSGFINGSGKIVFRNNVYGNLSGNVSEVKIAASGLLSANLNFPKIVFTETGTRTIKNTLTINADTEIEAGIILQDADTDIVLTINGEFLNNGIVQNFYSIYSHITSFTLIVNGKLVNHGTMRKNGRAYFYIQAADDIENNGTWSPDKSSLIWSPVQDSDGYEFQISDQLGNWQTATTQTTTSILQANSLFNEAHLWRVRSFMNGLYNEWKTHSINKIAEPEIAVLLNDAEITSGSQLKLEDLQIGSQEELFFQIKNSGDANLNLDAKNILFTGTGAHQLIVSLPPSDTILPHSVNDFKIQILATTPGIHSVEMIILNNDQDEGEYKIKFNFEVYSICTVDDWSYVLESEKCLFSNPTQVLFWTKETATCRFGVSYPSTEIVDCTPPLLTSCEEIKSYDPEASSGIYFLKSIDSQLSESYEAYCNFLASGEIQTHLAKNVEVGSEHSCVLLTNGKVACWGKNQQGQLIYFNSASEKQLNPLIIAEIKNVIDLRLQGDETCLTFFDQTQKCFGLNDKHRWQAKRESEEVLPISLNPSNIIDYALGEKHSCIVLDNKTVQCWGKNSHGQLGNGTKTFSAEPVLVEGI